MLIADLETTAYQMRRLAALGVRLSIDDFGAGYAGLGYLRGLPGDELKIDKSFVDGVGSTPLSASLVQTILTMSGQLGLHTVAEGIERDVQAQALTSLGCTVGQGQQATCSPIRWTPTRSLRCWPRSRTGQRAIEHGCEGSYSPVEDLGRSAAAIRCPRWYHHIHPCAAMATSITSITASRPVTAATTAAMAAPATSTARRVFIDDDTRGSSSRRTFVPSVYVSRKLRALDDCARARTDRRPRWGRGQRD